MCVCVCVCIYIYWGYLELEGAVLFRPVRKHQPPARTPKPYWAGIARHMAEWLRAIQKALQEEALRARRGCRRALRRDLKSLQKSKEADLEPATKATAPLLPSPRADRPTPLNGVWW